MSNVSSPNTKNSIPNEFKCSITTDILIDPVILSCSGQTYERSAILAWLARNSKCPLTNKPFNDKKDCLIPNISLKKLIGDFAAKDPVLKEKLESSKKDLIQMKQELDNVTWEWCSDLKNGHWTPYDLTTIKRLEAAYKNRKKMTPINSMYGVDVESMTQSDLESGSRNRPVRRIQGQKPKPNPYWSFQMDDVKNPRCELVGFSPMSPDDSEFLEQEYQKPEQERKMIRIGQFQQFLVSVTEMMQFGNFNDRRIKRVE